MFLKHIKKKGWTKFNQSNQNYEFEKLNEYINLLEDQLNKKRKSTEEIKTEAEVFKSTMRALLKFSPESKNFLFGIIKDITDINTELRDYYVSYPYFLVHMTNDFEEVGAYHNDTIKECGHSITCWSAVNNYKLSYSPLTLIEKTNNNFDQLLFKISHKFFKNDLILNRYYKIFKNIKNLKPEIMDSYLWDADTIHIGNLNKGSKFHYALTVKISEKPHLTEPSIRISEFLKENNKNDLKNKKIEFNDLFFYINKINKLVKEFYKFNISHSSLEALTHSFNEVKKEIDNPNLIDCISFAFSLIGYKQKDQKIALIQYFTSIYFKPNYLSSLHNVVLISKKIGIFLFLEYIKKNTKFNKDYQKTFLKKYKNVFS